jgi:alkylation response protein AidB-like acyl-CoA dehydrogenase
MVRALRNGAINENAPSYGAAPVERAARLASCFAAPAELHDREGSFPFENFSELSEAGLLALTVPVALGGRGAGG